MIAEMASFRRGLLRPTILVVLCCFALLAAVAAASAADEPRDRTTVVQELNAARRALNKDVAELERFARIYARIDSSAARSEQRGPHYDPARFDRDEPLKTCSYLAQLPRPARPSTVDTWMIWHQSLGAPLAPIRWLLDISGVARGASASELVYDLVRYEDIDLQDLEDSISVLLEDRDRLTAELGQLKQAEASSPAAASPATVDEPLDPIPGPPSINDGIRHYEKGEYGEAHRLFDQAANEGVEVGMAHYGRGSVQAVWGYHDRAFADFEVALAYMPKDARVHFSRGLLFQELDRDDEAIADFKLACDQRHELSCRYLRQQAMDREIRGNQALFLHDNRKQAETEYRAATEIDPDYPDPYFNLGVVLRKDGKWEKAVAAFRTYLRTNEQRENPRTFKEAEILYGRHRIETPPIDLRAEKSDQRVAASSYHWIGSIRHVQGRYAEAIGLYTRAMEILSTTRSPELPILYFNRGNAHVENRDRRAALADFRVACAANHADACARKDTLADEFGEPK